jgi:signal transduction histidine kinase
MQRPAIRLGLMMPMSGIVGIYGPELSRAAMLACDEINESGGILGRPLELAIEDDRSEPESAVAAAERLLDEAGCVALVGNLLSNARIAVAYRVAEPRRVPYLNFSFYEGSILSRYFFHFAALPNQQIDRMIPYMCERFGRRMYFAGNSYEWPRGSIDAARRALERSGGEVVGEEYFPLDASRVEIRRLIDSVASSRADVFVPHFAGSDQIRLLADFAERGLKDRIAVVTGHFDEQLASRLSRAARDGLYSCNTYFMSVDSEANRRLLARLAVMSRASGLHPAGDGILTNFGEATYLCVKAFAAAAKQAASVDPEALVDALERLQLRGPQGVVTMDPTLHHATVNCYLARCQADGTFEIVERFPSLPPELPERYRHLLVSQLKQARKEAELAKRTLAESDKMRALGQMAGGVAHDFNNLLTGIMGFAGLLQKQLADPTQLKFVDRIIQASRQASDLITSLLTFARRGSFAASPVDVHQVIRDAADLLQHMLPKGIAIELDLMADAAVVHGDTSQLQAVLINLAVNARDAMKSNGHLRIATRTLAPHPSACPVLADHGPAPKQLEISVADTGCGMTPEVIRRAFEPFFSTKTAMGAGLGLASVYGTIKLHRGDISIESKAGEGTVFRIALPLLDREAAGEQQAVAMEPRELPPNRSILLVDDEGFVVEAIAAQLETLGCRVVTFTRGKEALAWFKQHAATIDAVVLDLDMPEMSGSQIFSELRRIRPDAPIVLISGLGEIGIAQKLLDAGARSLLRKPFVAADLEAHLAHALG